MSVRLAKARYGKDMVRVLRVVRGQDGWHNIVEYSVCTLVEGDIDVSFTKADNSVVVATDSMKNITYYLAKVSPYILQPELFALHIGTHILSKYAHLDKAFVTVEQLRWARIPVGQEQKLHTHSFWRDGEEKRVVNVELDATAGKSKMTAKITSGLKGLLVIKTTGSAFENFVRDEYTTLVEVDDRIFSTSIDCSYTYGPVKIPATAGKEADDASGLLKEISLPFDDVAAKARIATLETFATDDSASVQATLYKMCERILSECADVVEIGYALPNKHYIPVDMRYIGTDNLTPAKADVFCPIAAPSGLITATVARAISTAMSNTPKNSGMSSATNTHPEPTMKQDVPLYP